jgi:hypothetical protein
MNFRSGLFCAGVLLSIAMDARAEGGTCPQGYYPVNTPGVMGCAPIPGSGSDRSSSAPRDPGPQWQTRWLSVVFGNNGFGAAVDMPSKRKAENAALAQCRAMGGTACYVNMTTYNQCIAVARGGHTAPSAGAHDQETAESLAIRECMKDAKNANCEIYYSACSYPVRIR